MSNPESDPGGRRNSLGRPSPDAGARLNPPEDVRVTVGRARPRSGCQPVARSSSQMRFVSRYTIAGSTNNATRKIHTWVP